MTGIILVDKPSGWTSNDVVCKLKGVLHTRKIGHSGTLDPMATGLLPVFVGKATKAVEFAENDIKHYQAGIRLGTVTDTLDITGSILSVGCPASENALTEALVHFTGKQLQTPPMYSALKVNGRKLYDIARSGEVIDRQAREIEIFSINLLGKESNGDYVLDVICSKGTYIRSLCDDIGRYLGCGACMSSLRRIGCGAFSVSDSIRLENLVNMTSDEIENTILIPVDSLFSVYPEFRLNEQEEHKVRNGNFINTGLPDGFYRIYSPNGDFLMLGIAENSVLKIRKNFMQ